MKFYELLEYWAYMLRSKALYHELKYYVKKKQTHIKRLHHFNGRGIGKTYNLMKISGKYKIPVIVPTITMANEDYMRFTKFNPIIFTPEQLRGIIKPGEVILVDDKDILNESIKAELDKYIQIGF